MQRLHEKPQTIEWQRVVTHVHERELQIAVHVVYLVGSYRKLR